MKESARRWSGYVCPDCRFVFRAPIDHDGQAGMCPGCGILLRIPAAKERLASLDASLPESAPEANELNSSGRQMQMRRRKKKDRLGADYAWDQKSELIAGSGVEEKRQMFWMMIGGATLFFLIVGVLAMLGGDDSEYSESQQLVEAAPPVLIESDTAETVPPSDTKKEDAAFIAEAKILAGKFLDARRIEEMLPLVRNPEVAEARMRSHYSRGEIEAPGLREFNLAGRSYSRGTSFEVQVRTRDYRVRTLAVCETLEGIKIDWESWVGWSEMPWEEFAASKPTTAKLFRVKLSLGTYYNFAFFDEKKWKAYRLESPDGAWEFYGYVESNSELDSQLKLPPNIQQAALTLLLKFPADAKTDNQVVIEKFIANGWLLETAKTP